MRECVESTAAGLAAGRVLSDRRDDVWTIDVDGEAASAAKAAGCLLDPEKGDLVLLAMTQHGRCYVIQVLERAGDGVAAVRLPGKSVLTAGGGEGELEIRSASLSLAGTALRSAFKRFSAAYGVLEAKADLWREQSRRRYEDVEDVRESRIGRLRCLVGGLLSLRGRTVDVKAEKRLKLDGDAVDIG